MDYREFNVQIIDGWIENGWEWGRPIRCGSQYRVVITDPKKQEWLAWAEEKADCRVLFPKIEKS